MDFFSVLSFSNYKISTRLLYKDLETVNAERRKTHREASTVIILAHFVSNFVSMCLYYWAYTVDLVLYPAFST